MKLKSLLFTLLLLTTIGAQAQNTLNVYQKDGTLLCFCFADKPMTLFVDDDVIVKTDKQLLSFPFSSIDKYTFEDGLDPSGLISIQVGEHPSEGVSIYDLSGKLLKTVGPSESRSVEIHTTDLPAGTYIIRNKGVSYKFQKK